MKYFQRWFPGFVEAQIFCGELKRLHILTLLLKPNTCVCRPWASHMNFQFTNYNLQKKKQLYEIKYSSIGPTNYCRLYYFQALLKSYLWNMLDWVLERYLCALATIRARESCGDCCLSQIQKWRLFFIWEQAVNGNEFTQRVTHKHQKLLSTRFHNEYNIILDHGLDHLFSILLFHLEVHLLQIDLWRICDSENLNHEVMKRKWENIAKYFEWLLGFELFIQKNECQLLR